MRTLAAVGRSPWGAALAVALLLGLCWAATFAAGGAGRVAPHWFYAPILLAASRFGAAGAGVVAVAAGVLAGPLMPLDVDAETRQDLSDWGTRAAFFLAIGLLMAGVIAGRRRADTKRLAAEHAVRGAEARTGAVLDSALDCIISMDHRGRVVEWNLAAERTFGYSRAEAIGRGMAELIVPPSLRERHRRGLAHYLATGEGPVLGTRIELTGMRRDGAEFPVELAITRVDLPGPPLFTGFVRDITRRKDREESLRRSMERLKLLRAIDLAILAADSTEELARATLSSIRDLIPCQRAAVAMYDFEAGDASVLATTFAEETTFAPGARIPLEAQGETGERVLRELRRGEVSVLEDIQTIADPPPAVQATRDEGLRAVLNAPLLAGSELLGVLSVASDVPRAFTDEHADIAREVANQLAIAIQQARLRQAAEEELEHRMRAEAHRRELLARLVRAQEEERKLMARELHDDSIQVVTAAGLRLDILRRRLSNPELRPLVEKAQEEIQASVHRLRHMLFELHPPALDREGLAASLEAYLEDLGEETGIHTHLSHTLQAEPGGDAPMILYRIVQEAMVNARKHAQASRLDVELEGRDGGILARVADDGVGFSPDEAAGEDRPGHLGIQAMRERAELAGGWCRVSSRPGQGTTVEAWLPANGEAGG